MAQLAAPEVRRHLQRALEADLVGPFDPGSIRKVFGGSGLPRLSFLAECSCERFNRYLDRSLVVPTLGHDPELAFF
jgi:hypothetical protein